MIKTWQMSQQLIHQRDTHISLEKESSCCVVGTLRNSSFLLSSAACGCGGCGAPFQQCSIEKFAVQFQHSWVNLDAAFLLLLHKVRIYYANIKVSFKTAQRIALLGCRLLV